MEEHWKELLERHDDPKHWEYPGDFSHKDHSEAVQRFQKFVTELKSLLGRTWPTETGIYIQDASFHSQILFVSTEDQQDGLRFSNFGNMIAFTPDLDIPDSIRDAVVSLAKQLEFVLVPTEILEEKYTGSNPGVTGIETWWIRYFDWV